MCACVHVCTFMNVCMRVQYAFIVCNKYKLSSTSIQVSKHVYMWSMCMQTALLACLLPTEIATVYPSAVAEQISHLQTLLRSHLRTPGGTLQNAVHDWHAGHQHNKTTVDLKTRKLIWRALASCVLSTFAPLRNLNRRRFNADVPQGGSHVVTGDDLLAGIRPFLLGR